MKYKRISEIEFNNINHHLLYRNEYYEHNRSFGEIICGENSFKFGWNSTAIEPILIELINNKFCLGIDQEFVIFDCNTRELDYKLNTDFFIIDIVKTSELVYICTELEILILNLEDNIPYKRIDLEEIFDEIIIYEKFIIIKCLNNWELKYFNDEESKGDDW